MWGTAVSGAGAVRSAGPGGAAAAVATPAAGFKICSSCLNSLPEADFSSAQLKRKGKRKCGGCVANSEETSAGAAAHSSSGSSGVTPTPPLSDYAVPDYYGRRDSRQLPSGEGLRLNANGDVVDYMCGVWEHGALVKQGAIQRAAVPKGAPLKHRARQCERIYPDGSCFVSEEREGAVGTGTLYSADGHARRSGVWKDGKQHGQGWAITANGDRWSGEFVADQRHGAGVLEAANGDRVVGEWVRNELVKGTEHKAGGGETYTGSFVRRRRHGVGQLLLADGTRYEGNFQQGKRAGSGTQQDGLTRCVYDGQWEDDERAGYGAEWSAEGELLRCGTWGGNAFADAEVVPCEHFYERRFLSEQARTAVLLWPDGSFYCGSLDNCYRPHGEGFHYPRYTRHRFEGGMLRGLAHGDGTMAYAHTPELVASAATHIRSPLAAVTSPTSARQQQPATSFRRYEGAWHAGSRVGQGRMQYADSSVYDGSWRDDRHGVGALLESSGALHAGQWSCGRLEGHGVEWDSEGRRVHCGWFVGGQCVREAPVPTCVITDPRYLTEPEREASLIFPDGRYFHGPLPSLLAPRLTGTLYDKQHRVMHQGAFAIDMQLHALA